MPVAERCFRSRPSPASRSSFSARASNWMPCKDQEVGRMVAIIDSMTPRERRDPTLLNGSRKQRVAKGSGTSVQDVNRLIKQYLEARKMMKMLSGHGGRQWLGR